jgi:NADPH:quinone reductase-like Zn-dependent oxidoreductase
MRAVTHHEYGSPDVLHLDDLPRPTPEPDQVLVEVHVTTLNRTDTGTRSGRPIIARYFSGWRRPKRPVLGSEFAGVVVEVGSAVTKFAVGDRVFGTNEYRFGAHAEYLALRETDPIAHMPPSMTFVEAAPICDGAILALNLLRRGGCGPGRRVLIHGAGGSIGSAAVQLTKHFGGHVTAVCDTDQVDVVRSLGADEVIDRFESDFTRNGQTYDFIFDAVGKRSFRECRRSLVPRGVFIHTDLGFLWQNPFIALVTAKLPIRHMLFPIPVYRQADVEFLLDLYGRGEYRPVVDPHVYPLEEMVEASRYVDAAKKTGNVLITVK